MARPRLGPERQSWQGTDYNERQYNTVHNALVGIINDGVVGVSPAYPGYEWHMVPQEKADQYIERGRRVLADFETQSQAPRGHARRWMENKTDELRRLLAKAEAVRAGTEPQGMTPEKYENLRRSLGVSENTAHREPPPWKQRSYRGVQDWMIDSWNNGDAARDGTLTPLQKAGLVEWGSRGWQATHAGVERGLKRMGGLEEAHVAASSNRCGYRVNYGNGQVGNTHNTLKDARREYDQLTQYREYAFIQFRDCETREWFSIPKGSHEARETHVVRDFNTLDDLIFHARDELGATHVVSLMYRGTGEGVTKLYFPRGGQYPYEEAKVWRKGGYWHAEGPGARTGVTQLPPEAVPIEQYKNPRRSFGWADPKQYPRHQSAGEARRRGGKGHLPQRYKHSSSTLSPDIAYKLADALAQRLGGTKPTMLQGGFRYSDRNESAQFTTYSPEHGQKVVVVASVFENGTTALNFFSDEGLSGTATYENIGNFTYNGADLDEMEKDVRWVWETVDGYAASWQQDDVDEVREANPRRSAHHKS